MGIKGLSTFLRKKYPDIFEVIYLEEYRYEKVAVDALNYIYKYIKFYGDEWIVPFIRFVSVFRECDIHCIFIFDSVAPAEKKEEQNRRKENFKKTAEKTLQIESDLKEYIESGKISPLLQEIQKKDTTIKNLFETQPLINVKYIQSVIKKRKEQAAQITQEHYNIVKQILDTLKIPYYYAASEAEKTCAELCKQNLVTAVVSEDTDNLAHGASVLLNNIDIKEKTCTRINHKKLVETIGFTEDQFLDFCILCGSDYNDNIPKVGPAKAFGLLERYENIENIQKNTDLDVTILNYKRVRNLLRQREIIKGKISYCGVPEKKDVEKIIEQFNLPPYIAKSIEKSFEVKIIIVDK